MFNVLVTFDISDFYEIMSLILHMSIKHGLFRYMKQHSSKYGATVFFSDKSIHILKIHVLI